MRDTYYKVFNPYVTLRHLPNVAAHDAKAIFLTRDVCEGLIGQIPSILEEDLRQTLHGDGHSQLVERENWKTKKTYPSRVDQELPNKVWPEMRLLIGSYALLLLETEGGDDADKQKIYDIWQAPRSEARVMRQFARDVIEM